MSGRSASLKRFRMALVATVALGLWHSPVPAQEVSSKVVGSAVLVVDQGRLFAESDFGRASIAREEKAARELEAENIRIQAELVAEEQELTFQRQSLPAEEFSARAEAFDQKVERIRAEQDAKLRDLSRLREEDTRKFFTQILPVLDAILLDRGAEVMLDKSVAIRFQESSDITDEAIARINAFLVAPVEVSP